MTDPRRSNPTAPLPKDPTRRAVFVAGILYLITFLASIPAVFLLAPIIEDPNYVLGGSATMQVGLGAVLDMVNALAAIGTAVAIFSVVKRQHEGLALGFVTTRLMEAAIIAIGVISLLAVMSLRTEGVAPADAGAAVVVGRTLVAGRAWTFLLGPCLMPALNALMFGTLLYRARLVPRAIPALGLVGAPVMIAFVIATMLGLSELGSPFNGIAGAPFFFWEAAIALWMIFKGFDRKAPIVAAAIAESSEPATSTIAPRPSGAIATEAGAA
jgi:Domain of unknown function (DUF4386)